MPKRFKPFLGKITIIIKKSSLFIHPKNYTQTFSFWRPWNPQTTVKHKKNPHVPKIHVTCCPFHAPLWFNRSPRLFTDSVPFFILEHVAKWWVQGRAGLRIEVLTQMPIDLRMWAKGRVRERKRERANVFVCVFLRTVLWRGGGGGGALLVCHRCCRHADYFCLLHLSLGLSFSSHPDNMLTTWY